MSETMSIAQQCRARRVLLTPKRLQMIERLEAREGAFDADALRAELIAQGVSVSRTMVYRTLRQLADEGVLSALGYREGRQLFSRRSGSMLRLVDTATGLSFEIDDAVLQTRIVATAAAVGVRINGRDVEVVLRETSALQRSVP